MAEELDIKIGTKEEALWTEVKEKAEKQLIEIEDTYFKVKTLQEAVIEMCDSKLQKIAMEKEDEAR